MKNRILIGLFCLFVKVQAGDALTVIKQEGHLNFTDGDSIYSFSSNRGFQMFPVHMSGPTIAGTWEEECGVFVITGGWGYRNGAFEPNDFRKMRMVVSIMEDANMAPNHRKEMVGDPGFTKIEVTKNVYFKIKELTKIKSPVQDFSTGLRSPVAAEAKAGMFAPFSKSITVEPAGSAIEHPGMRESEMPPTLRFYGKYVSAFEIDEQEYDEFWPYRQGGSGLRPLKNRVERDGFMDFSYGGYIYVFYKDGVFSRTDAGIAANDSSVIIGSWRQSDGEFLINGWVCSVGLQESAAVAVKMTIYISPGPTTCLSARRSSIGFRNRELTAAQFRILSFEEDTGAIKGEVPGRVLGAFGAASLSAPDMSLWLLR